MQGLPWAYKTNSVSREPAGVARFGIIHFLQTIHESERLLIPLVDEHDGVLLKVEGDSFLIIFRNVRKALHSALDMQRMLRIGDSDVFGAEVNAASKLGEDRAGPWEILVTDSVRDRCARFPELNVQFERLDEAPPGADSAYRVLFEL